MGKGVSEAQEVIGPTEFAHWQAYSRIEPFGPVQEDLRAAYPTMILFNAHRNPKKTSAKSAGDFFPSLNQFKKSDPFDSPDGQHLLAKMMTLAMGGKIVESK